MLEINWRGKPGKSRRFQLSSNGFTDKLQRAHLERRRETQLQLMRLGNDGSDPTFSLTWLYQSELRLQEYQKSSEGEKKTLSSSITESIAFFSPSEKVSFSAESRTFKTWTQFQRIASREEPFRYSNSVDSSQIAWLKAFHEIFSPLGILREISTLGNSNLSDGFSGEKFIQLFYRACGIIKSRAPLILSSFIKKL